MSKRNKIIAREFLIFMSVTVFFTLFLFIWQFIDCEFYKCSIDGEFKIYLVSIGTFIIFFLFRYIYYAIKWSIKQLRE